MSLQNKFNWLIDRKKELINKIKSLTTQNNIETNSVFSPSNIAGKTYADISWDDIVKDSNAFFPPGFVEVIHATMYNYNGYVLNGHYPNYSTDRGEIVNLTKIRMGVFDITLLRPNDLLSNSRYVLYGIGSFRGDISNNNGTYATISKTSSWDASPLTYRMVVGDQESEYDGNIILIIFAFNT